MQRRVPGENPHTLRDSKEVPRRAFEWPSCVGQSELQEIFQKTSCRSLDSLHAASIMSFVLPEGVQ